MSAWAHLCVCVDYASIPLELLRLLMYCGYTMVEWSTVRRTLMLEHFDRSVARLPCVARIGWIIWNTLRYLRHAASNSSKLFIHLWIYIIFGFFKRIWLKSTSRMEIISIRWAWNAINLIAIYYILFLSVACVFVCMCRVLRFRCDSHQMR